MTLPYLDWAYLSIIDCLMQKEEEIRKYLQDEFAISILSGSKWKEMQKSLSLCIDELIQRDFGKLVSILYRIDVSESKLRKVLSENADTYASELIAQMIMERQLQKLESREKFRGKATETDEDTW
jgi:hypothetical protein